MKTKNILFTVLLILFLLVISLTIFAKHPGYHCTNVAVGKEATVDGSAMIFQNFDTNLGDQRMWLFPSADYPEGAMRDIVVGGDMYVDYTSLVEERHPIPVTYYPEVTAYGEGGTSQAHKVGEIPQAPHTFAYLYGGSASINEKGVAIALSTHNPTWSPNCTEHGQEVWRIMGEESPGIIDIYTAQNIAMERATTAKEAVRIIGDLIEEYQWYGKTWGGESVPITDGDEIWVMEIYGRDIWVAIKIPDDHFYVSGNMARIREIDLEDKDKVMYSPNLVSFAVEQEWYDPNSGTPFYPADIYSPRFEPNLREWRALDIVAPSLNLDSDELYQPYSVKPDYKLSVYDLFKIQGDSLQGTKYDLTNTPGSGDWGNPLLEWEGKPRAINVRSTANHYVCQVKAGLPDAIKGICWAGFGAPDSSYHTPLWASMKGIPKSYYTGVKELEDFRWDSTWWINLLVQDVVERRYSKAIEDLYAFRDPKLNMLYEITPKVQELAASIYETDPKKAINLIHHFAYNNAVAMNEEWKKLAKKLLGKYTLGMVLGSEEASW